MKRRTLLQATAAAAGGWAMVGHASADNGVSDSEVLFGHSGVLSGPLGEPVKALLGGAQLAFDDANAQGGIAGRKIRLNSLDDELKPDRAVANYERLLGREKVFAFFGCVGSGTTAAAAPILKQSGAPMIGGYAVADSARDKVRGSAYFLRAGTGREAEVLVQHLTTLSVSNIGVAHLDNPGGLEALKLVEKALDASKLKPQLSVAVKGDGSNVAEAGKQLADATPQAVIMYLAGALPGELMKSVWAAGGHPAFYGMSIVPGDITAKVIGERARGLAISQVVPYPWGTVESVARHYQQLAARAGVPVNYYTYEGFLNASVALEALRRTGRELTRPRLHATLRDMHIRMAGMDVDFTSGSISGSRFVEMVQVSHDGRFVR